jgi:hypothetical protein
MPTVEVRKALIGVVIRARRSCYYCRKHWSAFDEHPLAFPSGVPDVDTSAISSSSLRRLEISNPCSRLSFGWCDFMNENKSFTVIRRDLKTS